MASPFPFTSGQVLTAAQLNSIGEATAFTPSWNNLTPGNAVESWHYVQVNEVVHFTGQTRIGSTTSITGLPQFQFPVGTQLSPVGSLGGIATYFDTGSSVINVGLMDLVGGYIRFFNYTVSGSLVGFAGVSASSPFTFATNDIIRATGALLLA